jgi:hypothetical protein
MAHVPAPHDSQERREGSPLIGVLCAASCRMSCHSTAPQGGPGAARAASLVLARAYQRAPQKNSTRAANRPTKATFSGFSTTAFIWARPSTRAAGHAHPSPDARFAQGLIFGPTGVAMTPDALKRDPGSSSIRRVPAAEIENAVIDQLRGMLRAPEIIVRTWRAARQLIEKISEAEVREALECLDPLWDELFPAEQARIVQLLVERVDVSPDGADIQLRTEGLTNLVADLRSVRPETLRAA